MKTMEPKERINRLGELIGSLDLDSLQKYVFGYRKNGKPRALYDIYRDHTFDTGKKKGSKGKKNDRLSFYLGTDKKKKKRKKNKSWRWGD